MTDPSRKGEFRYRDIDNGQTPSEVLGLERSLYKPKYTGDYQQSSRSQGGAGGHSPPGTMGQRLL